MTNEKETEKKTLLRVNLNEGVLEDNLYKHLGWIYDIKVYDENYI